MSQHAPIRDARLRICGSAPSPRCSAAYAAWTGLSYLGKVGGGIRMTAFLPTSGDSLGPASNVKYHGLVVGRVVTISGEAGKSRAEIVLKPDQASRSRPT